MSRLNQLKEQAGLITHEAVELRKIVAVRQEIHDSKPTVASENNLDLIKMVSQVFKELNVWVAGLPFDTIVSHYENSNTCTTPQFVYACTVILFFESREMKEPSIAAQLVEYSTQVRKSFLPNMFISFWRWFKEFFFNSEWSGVLPKFPQARAVRGEVTLEGLLKVVQEARTGVEAADIVVDVDPSFAPGFNTDGNHSDHRQKVGSSWYTPFNGTQEIDDAREKHEALMRIGARDILNNARRK